MALYLGNTKITPIISKGTSTAKLITKSVDSNGVYSAADDDADGYSKFTVNVQYTGQEKTLNPSKTTQIIVPDSGYSGITKITLNPVTSSIDENIISSNIKQGVSILGVTGTLETKADPVLQSKTITPTKLNQTITPDTGYDALSSVIVNGVTSDIDSNITAGNIKEGVSILGITGTLKPVAAPNLQNKSATPLTTNQTIEPDEGYDGLSYVNISKVDSSIDSNIVAGNIKKDISILGVTGTYEGDGSAYTTTQVYNALKANYDTNGTFTDNVTYTVKGTVLHYVPDYVDILIDGTQTELVAGVLTDGTTNLAFVIRETSSFNAEYLKYKISKGDCITVSGKFKYFTTAQTIESIPYNVSSPYFDQGGVGNIGILSGFISKGINTLRNLLDHTKQTRDLFYEKQNIPRTFIEFNDTINVTEMSKTFYNFQGNEIPKINMNSAIKAINMFYNTPYIQSLYLVMPNLVNTSNMFYLCKNTEEIFIKNSRGMNIEDGMFSHAQKARLIDIDTVQSMQQSRYFIQNCAVLNKLIIRNVPKFSSANYNSFDEWNKLGYIYLPSDKINNLGDYWSKVSDRLLPIFSKTTLGSGTITETVQEDGKTQLTAVPADGYTFAGWYNGVIGNILQSSNPQELTITAVEGQKYGFTLSDAEASSTRYYESNNKGIGPSVAYGRFYFTITDTNQKVKMIYISYGEGSTYDYGMYYLNKADGTNVSKNENLGSSPDDKTVYFENLALGDYYIEVRYKKDGSGNNYNDSLKVKAEIATYTTEQGIISTTSETGLTTKTAETVEFKNVPEISQYGFALNTNGYYESNNKGIPNSVAVGRFYFDNYNTYTKKDTSTIGDTPLNKQSRLNIEYISSGQYNGSYVYDYGTAIIYDMYGNKIREILNDGNSPTNGLGASGISTSTYIDDLPTGRYYLEVRFIKDASTDSNNDSLQIKVSVDTYSTVRKSIPDSGLFDSDATTTVLINEKYMQPLNLIAKFVQGE